MAEVLICPVGAINKASLRALRKAGVVVVQTDNPERIKFVRASEIVSNRDLFWAAMNALQADKYSGGTLQRETFTKLVFGLVDSAKKRDEDAQAINAVDPHV